MSSAFVGAECGEDTIRHFNAMCADLPGIIKASLADPATYDEASLAVIPALSETDPEGTVAIYAGAFWRRIGMGPWEKMRA